jgi:hypothetical protein
MELPNGISWRVISAFLRSAHSKKCIEWNLSMFFFRQKRNTWQCCKVTYLITNDTYCTGCWRRFLTEWTATCKTTPTEPSASAAMRPNHTTVSSFCQFNPIYMLHLHMTVTSWSSSAVHIWSHLIQFSLSLWSG